MSILDAPHFHDEAAAFTELEAILWPDGPVCPHCGGLDRVYALKGVRSKPSKRHPEGVERHGLKKCGHCRKQFTVRVGTVFEDSHAPVHKWLQAIHLLCSSKKGISSHQLHRILEVQYNTAWFLSHRIREAMRVGGLAPMGGAGGVVETDETIYGRAATHPKGRGPHGPQVTGSSHKNVVLALVQRGGGVRTFHVSGSTIAELMPLIDANVAKEAAGMTGAASWYKYMNEPDEEGNRRFVSHDHIDHSEKKYARYEEGSPRDPHQHRRGLFLGLQARHARGLPALQGKALAPVSRGIRLSLQQPLQARR